jgi:hypothetical protein
MMIFIFAMNDENRFLNYSEFTLLGWFIISTNFIIIAVYIFFDIMENSR